MFLAKLTLLLIRNHPDEFHFQCSNYICWCQHPVYGEVLLVLPLCNPTCLYWFIHHQYGVGINFIDPVKSSVGRTQILRLFICQPEEGTALHWCHNQCCWWQSNHSLLYVELKCGTKLRLYIVFVWTNRVWFGLAKFGMVWSSLVLFWWFNFVWSSLVG